jgi:hypothetical protein
MNISYRQRITKLLGNLLSNPRLLLPYIRYSLLNRKLPAEIQLPWWSFKAIQRADKLLLGKRVFEWGSGGSTTRYAKTAKEWCSVEDDAIWLERIRRLLPPQEQQKTTFQYHPFDFRHPEAFDRSSYLRALDREDWEVIIIDGQDWSFEERVTCFKHAQNLVSPGAVIILDDYWRYQARVQPIQTASMIEVCESVGPCRIGVTSTAFFYY